MASEDTTPITMVRYNRPFAVAKRTEKKKKYEFVTRRPQTAGVSLDSEREVRDLLNIILPPRCWIDDNQVWKQTVSSMPATREDVIHLQELLDTRLQDTQARETGICAVRRALYAECFDEVIRQVTINCSERGLLLVRIRDEMEVTLEAYERLYCSAVGFGIRKALQSHIEKEVLAERVTSMEIARDTMEEVVEHMKRKFELGQRKAAEAFAIEEKRFHEEMAFLKKTNVQVKAQLDAVMGPRK